MKKLILCLLIATVGSIYAKPKSSLVKVSCASVKGAKRKSFKWKGQPSAKTKTKICKSIKRKPKKTKKS